MKTIERNEAKIDGTKSKDAGEFCVNFIQLSTYIITYLSTLE